MVALFKKKKKALEDLNGKRDLAITNYLTDALLVFDHNSRVVLVNPQAERFFEVIEERVLGKSISLNHKN